MPWGNPDGHDALPDMTVPGRCRIPPDGFRRRQGGGIGRPGRPEGAGRTPPSARGAPAPSRRTRITPGDVMQNYSFACTRSACGDCCLLPELTFGEIPKYLDKCIIGLRWHLHAIDPVYSFHEERPLTEAERRDLAGHIEFLGYPKMIIAGLPAILDIVPVMSNVYKRPNENDIICPFLEPDKTCRIYDDRPLYCRCQPFSRLYPDNLQYFPLLTFRRHHDCLHKCLHKRIPHIYGENTFLDSEYATNYANYIHETKAGMHIIDFIKNLLLTKNQKIVPPQNELVEMLIYKMWLNTSLLPYFFMGLYNAKLTPPASAAQKVSIKMATLEMIRIQTEVAEREIVRTAKLHPDLTEERIKLVRDLISSYSLINDGFARLM
jgi:Fe-S-cluster containining protein